MATVRLDIRLNEDTSNVIAGHGMMVVEGNVFDQFVEACDKANKPNAALLAAAAFTKESHVE